MRFATRRIPFVVAQEHVPGDLVKFYGLRDAIAGSDSSWFEWFYHRDHGMLGYSFDVARLRRAALGAAAALGLEIFGASHHPGQRRTGDRRHQCLAKLCAISGSGCTADRGLSDRALPAAAARGSRGDELIA